MGREAPMNPSPVGKPSVSSLGTPKGMGQAVALSGSGTEYNQVSAPTSTSAKSGATAAGKGKFSLNATPGKEYRQASY